MTIEEILHLAKERDASDIHMAPWNPLMFRIHGKLIPLDQKILDKTDVESLIRPMMTKTQLVDLERTGELDFAFTISGCFCVRVNIFRQRGTYAASLRLLSYEVPTPEVLGVPKSVIELTKQKNGLVLITGTAGSGKSTTLASLIDVIAERNYKNIITLEDPIEYLHSHKKAIVSQREIGCDTKSYADGIQAALRQDPDVIMVGELRDTDTILAALAAAETGHLVFAALHTCNTVDAITRLIEVFPPHQQQQVQVQLASVLRGATAQQLLPRSDIDGRTAAFEVLLTNQSVKNLIREGKNYQIANVIQNSKKEGMQSMDDAILDAYMHSQITKETAISYAQNPDGMAQKMKIF